MGDLRAVDTRCQSRQPVGRFVRLLRAGILELIKTEKEDGGDKGVSLSKATVWLLDSLLPGSRFGVIKRNRSRG